MEQVNRFCNGEVNIFRFLIAFLLVLNACTDNKQSLQWNSYTRYLQEESNGILKKKKVKDIELTIQYLPSDYIAYKELNNLKKEVTPGDFDSLRSVYLSNETYILTVDYVSTPVADLLWSGIVDQQMYQERIYVLSFRMAEYIKRKRGGKTYNPALVHYDAVPGLDSKIKIMAVFPKGESIDVNEQGIKTNEDRSTDIVFEDPFWNTGLHHFVFNNKDIEQIPALRID